MSVQNQKVTQMLKIAAKEALPLKAGNIKVDLAFFVEV
jgi:hypothetical protein